MALLSQMILNLNSKVHTILQQKIKNANSIVDEYNFLTNITDLKKLN